MVQPAEERNLLNVIEATLKMRAAQLDVYFPGEIDAIADVGFEDNELRILTHIGNKYRVEVSRADIPV